LFPLSKNDILRADAKNQKRHCFAVKKALYAKLPTEQNNPRSQKIDRLSVEQILEVMNREDQSVPRAVAKVKPQISQGVKIITSALKQGGRLFFAGAGTSGRLGVLEAAECPPTFDTPPSLVQAVMAGGPKAVFRSQEGAEDNKKAALRIFSRKLKKKDVVVGVAASGVTPFVAGAFEAARRKKCRTILVACNDAVPFKHLIDCLIAPKVGPEVITGSTRLKAGTATKLVLNMLTVASMIRLGKVYKNWMVDLQPKSRKLVFRGLRLIEELGGVPGPEAEKIFEASQKHVKVAILMAQKGWDYPAAVRKLRKANGFLQKALDA
jgi:N-acetylmuramic acid 6-phosphate etherase